MSAKDVAGSTGPSAARGRRFGPLRWICWCATWAAALFWLWGECARWFVPGSAGPLADWLSGAEIAAQVRVPFGQLAAGILVPLVLLRMKRAIVVLFLVLAGCLGPTMVLALAPRPEPGEGPRLRVVTANLLWPNPRHDEVLDAIEAQAPDLIGLVEVSAGFRAAALARFGATHPHVAEGTDTGGWGGKAVGQMVLSRHPLLDAAAAVAGLPDHPTRPIVQAVVDAPGGPVSVQLVHAVRPGNARMLSSRARLLEALAAGGLEGSRILMGDLNTASSSPLFRRLVERGRLVDTRRGFGRQPTWSHYPVQVPLAVVRALRPHWSPGVAIDHVLVSPDLAAVRRDTFTVPGSDHRGVVVELARRLP